MSAPVVAAFASKISSFFKMGYYPSGSKNAANGFNASGALLKAMLVHSGQKMKYIMNNTAGGEATVPYLDISANDYPSDVQGYGKIQMNKVLNFGDSSNAQLSLFVVGSSTPDQPHYAALHKDNNQNDTYTFLTPTSHRGGVRFTFAYTDLPGTSDTEVMQNILTMKV